MQDALYPHDTLFAAVRLIARHFAFDDDFRSCRNREAGEWGSYHLHRFAAQRPGIVVFAHPGLGRRRSRRPSRGIAAQDNRDGTGAFHLPIFSRDLFAMLMVYDPQGESIFVDDAGPVGANIHPTTVRVLGDDHIAGADITPAVMLVPFR